MATNLPALRLTLAYLLTTPPSLLPHITTPTLLTLPLPLTPSLPPIRALVLDKDNTLCPPTSTLLHPSYLSKLSRLRSHFPHPHSILIVSNTAGSTRSPAHESEAVELESTLSIPVLRQDPRRRKPFCGPEILAYFKEHGVTEDPAEIVVVGDRLATDVLLAREMGCWSVWVRDGWRNPEMGGRDYRGVWGRWEARFERVMRGGLGYVAPVPRGWRWRSEKGKV